MLDKFFRKKKEFERELTGFQSRVYSALNFLLKFSVLSLPLYILLWLDWNPLWLRGLNAELSSFFLNFLGVGASSSGTKVVTDSLLLDVSTDSTGWKSFFALSALFFSSDMARSSKLKAVGSGLLAVFCVNLLRITSMVFLVEVFSVSYELLHTVLWRWGLTGFILIYWFLWTYRR